jgi:Kef-type K+ transport system membrane component KefB
MHSVFYELAALLLLSALAGGIAVRLKQPVLVAYILVGIAVGPAGLGWSASQEQVALLAEIGVTVLLFVVGLKLDFHLVRNLGPVALATGLGQLGFTIFFGFFIALGLGLDTVPAIYVAVALTFSSTIIIVKLLSDKREIDSLHGRIALGFLIVQDIAVVIAMMMIGTLSAEGASTQWLGTALSVVGRLTAAVLLVAMLMRWVLPRVMQVLAESQELLLVFAIAWGTSLAVLGEMAGFSKEVGALLAGFSLAGTDYREAVSSRLSSVRDFLLLFFFIDLGSKLDFTTLGSVVEPAIVLSLFVLIGNPLIVMAIMGYMGYRARTGFLAGLTVAQISEFSIIFVGVGIAAGHIGIEALGLVTLVGLITISMSTYMILYSHPLYHGLSRWLRVFERERPFREMAVERNQRAGRHAEVIVFGLGRYGGELALGLRQRGIAVLGVDFDPELVRVMRGKGLATRFGDADNIDFIETLPLGHARWVVSTLPALDVNLSLLHSLRKQDFAGQVALTAHQDGESEILEQAGANLVFYLFQDAARFAAKVIGDDLAPAEPVAGPGRTDT